MLASIIAQGLAGVSILNTVFILRTFVPSPFNPCAPWWYVFFFQMPYAETAVAHNDIAFVERL